MQWLEPGKGTRSAENPSSATPKLCDPEAAFSTPLYSSFFGNWRLQFGEGSMS